MAWHNDIGRKGELLAVAWLKEHEYTVLHVNWRHSHYEIDIVATHNNTLHFIEVKTRNSTTFGFPEESVSKKKFNSLMNAAEEYLFQHPEWKRVQYDILSITNLKDQPVEYFLVEDVHFNNL